MSLKEKIKRIKANYFNSIDDIFEITFKILFFVCLTAPVVYVLFGIPYIIFGIKGILGVIGVFLFLALLGLIYSYIWIAGIVESNNPFVKKYVAPYIQSPGCLITFAAFCYFFIYLIPSTVFGTYGPIGVIGLIVFAVAMGLFDEHIWRKRRMEFSSPFVNRYVVPILQRFSYFDTNRSFGNFIFHNISLLLIVFVLIGAIYFLYGTIITFLAWTFGLIGLDTWKEFIKQYLPPI